MNVPTLSRLQTLAVCPGALGLPWQRDDSHAARLGSAAHEWIASTLDGGPPLDPMSLVPRYRLLEAEAQELAYIAATFKPPISAGALTEIPLALLADGSVVRIPACDSEHRYTVPEGAITWGTIDAMWAEPGLAHEVMGIAASDGSTLYVVDFKTGSSDSTAPIAFNWQLRAGALLAARWTGATRVVPAVVYARAGEGIWDQGEPLGPAGLEEIERELRKVVNRARGAQEDSDAQQDQRSQSRVVDFPAASGDQRAGGSPGEAAREAPGGVRGSEDDGAGPLAQRDRAGATEARRLSVLVLGPHCTYCPARLSCPAKLSEMRALMAFDGPAEVARAEAWSVGMPGRDPLTVEQLATMVAMIPSVEKAIEAVRSHARAHVAQYGPLRFPDGHEWGPVKVERETLDAEESMIALQHELVAALPPLYADRALWDAFTTSKAALKRTIDEALAEAGIKRQGAATFARFMARLRDAGGVETIESETWTTHWPERAACELPEGEKSE